MTHIRQNDIQEGLLLPDEMHMIGMFIHERYETHESEKSFTHIFYKGEILTTVANVRAYDGAAVDCEGDVVPFTVVVTRTKGDYHATIHNHGDWAILFDNVQVEKYQHGQTTTKIGRGEY